jgi:hypothetical protein
MNGPKNPHWRGGRALDKDGYVLVQAPERGRRGGYILEHRLTMEKKIGRAIRPDEIVHHKNEIKSDNRISNLELLSKKEHDERHREALIRKRWPKKKE